MKKIISLMTAFTIMLMFISSNVSAVENTVSDFGNSFADYELIELSEQEKEAADSYIEALEYDNTGVSMFSSRVNDFIFEYDYTNDFFYRQLNSEEKELYKNTYIAAKKIQNSDVDFEASENQYNSAFCERITYSSTISNSRVMEIYRAFRFSNPQFFFFGTCAFYGGYSSGSFNGSRYLYLRVGEMFLKSADRKAMINTISQKTLLWLSEINKCTNPLEKELKIIEILCDNIVYGYGFDISNINEKAEYHQTIAGAIGKGQCVCNGYAMAFSYLCHLADIDCIGVVGKGHAWNRVKLFGDWYETDVTWIDRGRSNIWRNKSTEVFLAQDSARNTTAHTPRADLYTTLSLPECLKNDPVVPEYILGDVNGDYKITAVDLILVRRYIVHINNEISPAADMNNDGKITSADFILLRRLYVFGD